MCCRDMCRADVFSRVGHQPRLDAVNILHAAVNMYGRGRHTGFHDADGGLGGKSLSALPATLLWRQTDPRPAPVRPAVNVNICQRSYVGDGNADARTHGGDNFAVEGAVNPACCSSASPFLREQVKKGLLER